MILIATSNVIPNVIPIVIHSKLNQINKTKRTVILNGINILLKYQKKNILQKIATDSVESYFRREHAAVNWLCDARLTAWTSGKKVGGF